MKNQRSAFCRIHSICSKILLGLTVSLLTFTASAEGKYMVSAANPHAAKAGQEILAKGGSAVDAAIAIQMVLTLVEPQSSGIGGGAFMLFYDKGSKSITTFDGREKAPAAVTPDYFLKEDGTKLKFYEAVVGGKAVGVPGVLAMLEKAHQKYGKLPWKDLFSAAITLSEEGFEISPRLHYLLDRDKFLKTKAIAADYFYNTDGSAKPVGTVLTNPELAATLTLIAEKGSQGFYKGAIAEDIVKAVANDAKNPGLLNLQDLATYESKERTPVCILYRTNKVCGMGPPTSGGLTSLQILKLLERYPLGSLKPLSTKSIHLIAEASALAFADRGLFMADEDFVSFPKEGLLSAAYTARRSSLIQDGQTNIPYSAGDPDKAGYDLSPDQAIELPSTSHFSVVDQEGNAVSMTTSVENVFGSRLMVRGFILNNQLTDFSFLPEKAGQLINNRIEPGKRPRSSMSPTIVLDEQDQLRLVIGSPGGSRIIGYVTKTLIANLDWGLSIQEAINLPHFINRNGTLDLEEDTQLGTLQEALEKLGHKVKLRSLNSGLHGIEVVQGELRGGADPRREGVVLGN
ncbi:gamma-glutamyltransferase [Sneathiella limimaris]|uniref:gamma-glutamyltransferase n=1 Tax=Sneathiella limimaris TaxID=1964213 RepID=UPI001469F3FF|nr:gamma-glutamyltransferase [Sneathiella limimaris]